MSDEKTFTEKASDFIEEVKGKFYDTKEKSEADEKAEAVNKEIDEKMAALNIKDNLSAVVKTKGVLTLEQRDIPKPGYNEVLIAMHSVGICGTDVHFYIHGQVGDIVLKSPMVSGHESSGTVVVLGPGVTNLQIGDRVAIEPFNPCRYCRFCKTGRYNLCPDVKTRATPPTDGTLCRYIAHPADFCFKLPDHVDLEEGALLEPLSVAVNSCKRSNISSGDKVLICGAGTIGVMCLLAARAMGATKICITDVDEIRLQKAKNFGADCTLNVQCNRDPKLLAKQVSDLMGGQPDCSMECCGDEQSIQLAILATRSGGVCQLVGLGNQYVNVPILEAVLREVDIRGTLAYPNCYPAALAMVASGSVNVKPLITHRFPLEDSLQAFNMVRDNQPGTLKVVIKCSNDSVNFTTPAALAGNKKIVQ